MTAASYSITSAKTGVAILTLIGDWKISNKLPKLATVADELGQHALKQLSLDCSRVTGWDTGLLTFLFGLKHIAKERSIEFQDQSLPQQLQSLLKLAFAVDAREGAMKCPQRNSFIEELGTKSLTIAHASFAAITFIGEVMLALRRLLFGRSSMRRKDLFLAIQRSGPDAFPIVTLISVLVGVILAFIGAVQLSQFGAQLFVANLVAVGMAREMGAVMVGVILAGRTGAAYAAELGAMQANEEIDALETLAISPFDFLVMPRMVALMIMTPLLCVYADILGVLGGAFVTFVTLDIPPRQYWEQTLGALVINDFLLGIIKSVVFGALIATAGCLRGMQSARDSAAVGNAATSAVVTSIVLLVVTDAVFAMIATILGV